MRRIITVPLACMLCIISFTAAYAFTDTDNSAYKSEIAELTELGVLSGYDDGTFRPKTNITRAEAAKIFAVAKGFTGKPTDYYFLARRAWFLDFTSSHWAFPYAYYLMPEHYRVDESGNEVRAVRVIDGFEDGTFRPNNNITVMEFLKMAVCCHEQGYYTEAVENGGYPDGYMYVAEKYGFSDGIDLASAEKYITREQAAKILSNTINIPLVRHAYLPTITDEHMLDGMWISILCDGNSNKNYPLESLKTMLQSGDWTYHSVCSATSPLENTLTFYAYGTIQDIKDSKITIVPSVVVNTDASLYDGIDMLTVQNDNFDLIADNTLYYFEFNKQNGVWTLKNYAKV